MSFVLRAISIIAIALSFSRYVECQTVSSMPSSPPSSPPSLSFSPSPAPTTATAMMCWNNKSKARCERNIGCGWSQFDGWGACVRRLDDCVHALSKEECEKYDMCAYKKNRLINKNKPICNPKKFYKDKKMECRYNEGCTKEDCVRLVSGKENGCDIPIDKKCTQTCVPRPIKDQCEQITVLATEYDKISVVDDNDMKCLEKGCGLRKSIIPLIDAVLVQSEACKPCSAFKDKDLCNSIVLGCSWNGTACVECSKLSKDLCKEDDNDISKDTCIWIEDFQGYENTNLGCVDYSLFVADRTATFCAKFPVSTTNAEFGMTDEDDRNCVRNGCGLEKEMASNSPKTGKSKSCKSCPEITDKKQCDSYVIGCGWNGANCVECSSLNQQLCKDTNGMTCTWIDEKIGCVDYYGTL